MMQTFEQELSDLLNKHSIDNDCNTPDFILADMVTRQIDAYRDAQRQLAQWKGGGVED